MASIGVREASFGRSSGATKTVRSAARAIGRLQARVPLTVRGVRIVLRTSAAAAATGGASAQPELPAADGAGRTAEHAARKASPALRQDCGPGEGRRRAQFGWPRRLRRWIRAAAWAAWSAARRAVLWLVPALQSVPLRLLAGIAVQCACALLSAVPVRFKDVQITHQVRSCRAIVVQSDGLPHASLKLLLRGLLGMCSMAGVCRSELQRMHGKQIHASIFVY